MSVKYIQNLITSYFFKKTNETNENNEHNENNENNEHHSITIYGYNNKTGNWHCLDCGENMGDNARQLCGKDYCYNSV